MIKGCFGFKEECIDCYLGFLNFEFSFFFFSQVNIIVIKSILFKFHLLLLLMEVTSFSLKTNVEAWVSKITFVPRAMLPSYLFILLLLTLEVSDLFSGKLGFYVWDGSSIWRCVTRVWWIRTLLFGNRCYLVITSAVKIQILTLLVFFGNSSSAVICTHKYAHIIPPLNIYWGFEIVVSQILIWMDECQDYIHFQIY